MNAKQVQQARYQMGIQVPRTPAQEVRTQAVLHSEYRRLVAQQMAAHKIQTTL